MLKRLITYLYNRYCKQEVKSLYLGGVQRNLDVSLSEGERSLRQISAHSFLEDGWFEQILNESIKEYSEVLFNICEKDKQRDIVHNNISVLLNFEEKFKVIGARPMDKKSFDKFETI